MLMEYLFTTDLEIFPCGQATMIREKQVSAEPDKSWCLGEEKEFPDIVLEVVLTNGGLDRLAMYRCFPVPEVWFWCNDGLEIWHLKVGGSGYDGPVRASRLLPGLDFDLVERCVALPSWREARRAFQAGLKKEWAAKSRTRRSCFSCAAGIGSAA